MSTPTREELEARVRQLEQALQRFKVMETAVEATQILVAVMDLDSTLQSVNPAYHAVMGYDPEEMIGRQSFEFNHPQDQKWLRPLLDRYVAEITVAQVSTETIPLTDPVHYRFRHKDGGWRWLESIGTITNGHLYSFSRDISPRKEAEQQRDQMQKQLVNAARLASVSTLSAGLAHELNNPLTAVIGYSEMIEDGPEDEHSVATRARRIRTAAQRMKEIVDHIRRFSRPARFNERQHLEINEMIRDSLVVLEHSLEEKKIQLNLELAEDLPRVAGEPNQIISVFQHLIINAMDAFESAGIDERERRIRIYSARSTGEGVQVIVEDNAGGMSEEVARQAFDPFFTTKKMGKGVGLGLFVSQGIINDHDSTLSMSTEKGSGTRFEIHFSEAR